MEEKDKHEKHRDQTIELLRQLHVRANVATLIAGIVTIIQAAATGEDGTTYESAEQYLLKYEGALANAVVQDAPLPAYTGGVDSGSWSVLPDAPVIDPNSISWGPQPDSSGVALLD